MTHGHYFSTFFLWGSGKKSALLKCVSNYIFTDAAVPPLEIWHYVVLFALNWLGALLQQMVSSPKLNPSALIFNRGQFIKIHWTVWELHERLALDATELDAEEIRPDFCPGAPLGCSSKRAKLLAPTSTTTSTTTTLAPLAHPLYLIKWQTWRERRNHMHHHHPSSPPPHYPRLRLQNQLMLPFTVRPVLGAPFIHYDNLLLHCSVLLRPCGVQHLKYRRPACLINMARPGGRSGSPAHVITSQRGAG